ncbi:MAG: PEP-CTERM sorting domain-containing protein [Tepidisphaeraceae bacterium]
MFYIYNDGGNVTSPQDGVTYKVNSRKLLAFELTASSTAAQNVNGSALTASNATFATNTLTKFANEAAQFVVVSGVSSDTKVVNMTAIAAGPQLAPLADMPASGAKPAGLALVSVVTARDASVTLSGLAGAESGGPASVGFAGGSGSAVGVGGTVNIPLASFTSSVPEPTALLSIGLVALGLKRSRR